MADTNTNAASQRAFAVARLKRAASLPRMKDGRRPPMHPEAGVSEGERPSPVPPDDSDILDTPPQEPEPEPEPEVEEQEEVEQEQEVETEPPEPSTTPGPALSPPATPGPDDASTSTDKKKRRRSRSRGRGSRDYKAKAAAQARAAAQTPVPLDSSADEIDPLRAPSPFFATTPMFAPIPSPLALWTAQRAFAAQTPEPGMFYPPGPISSPGTPYPVTSPSTLAPGTGVPTLQDLTQHVFVRGLQRSNSAAAQLMLSKLQTPGARNEAVSPTTTPPPNALFRSNTVGSTSPAAGGDRSAARQNLLRRLGSRRRAGDGGDESQPSGAEDVSAPVVSPGRRKRRSKRASQPRGEDNVDVVDDREEMSSATSPLERSAPLPRRTSIERSREDAMMRLLGSPVDPRPLSRGVVVEDDLDGPDFPTRSSGHRSPLPAGLPATPPPRGPGVSKLSGASDDSGMSVPLKLSDTIHNRHELFPSSPFATPLRERDEDLGAGLGDVAGHEPMPELNLRWGVDDREVSWVDPEPASSDESEYEDDGDNEGEGEGDNDAEVNGTFGPLQRQHQVDDSSPEYDHGPSSAPDTTADYSQPDITIDTTAASTSSPHRRSSVTSVEIEHPSSPEPDHVRDGPPSANNSHHSHESQLSHRGPLVEPASPVSPSRSGAPSPFAPVIEHTRSGSRAEAASPLPHTVHRQISNESADRYYPARLSVASPSPGPSNTEWDASISQGQVSVDRERDGKGGGWEKVKRAFIRTGTPVRRRSRSGSVRERGNTDSSVSRESRGSMSNNSKDALSPYLPASPAQTPGASPNLPLPHHPSTEAMARYAASDAKLHPFPGIIPGLQRLNVSSPDIARPMNVSSPDVSGAGGYFSPTSAEISREQSQGGEGIGTRERKLSHQASDSRLLSKFAPGAISPSASGSSTDGGTSGTWRPGPMSALPSPSAGSNGTTAGTNGKLPHTRDGVRKWLSAKKIFTSSSGSSVDSPNGNGHERSASRAAGSVQISGPVLQAHDPAKGTVQHPLLVEMFAARERERNGNGNGNGSSGGEGWEDVDRTPTGGARPLNGIPEPSKLSMRELEAAYGEDAYAPTPEPISPAVARQSPETPYTASPHSRYAPGSPPDPLSTTPDPMSSLDDVSRSQSTLSSDAEGEEEESTTQNHVRPSPSPVLVNAQGPAVLARLQDALPSLPDPPRKLLLSSPVLQVANADTVKDRFLFLFTDLLIIAKPLAPEADADSASRRFVVKSAARLRELKFAGERAVPTSNLTAASDPRIRVFVKAFSEDPSVAVRTLLAKAGGGLDANASALGRLLFRTLELDRARLGEYLIARNNRPVLKAYIGQLALEGLPVHVALRAFLQSVHVPSTPGAAEYLLDAFAGRWYDANRDGVAFDRDLAVRLVRALAQLDDVLHGGSFAATRRTGAPHNVTTRDFRDAFRRFDARRAVPDAVLDDAHASVRRAALGCAPRTTPDASITFKRPVPARLTFKVQSEPVIVRLPAPDSGLTISLYGSGLTFDPPVLTFTRSPEASFRVTGSQLGARSIAFVRGGPRAAAYGGLPASVGLVVERAFMRNTFQVAFSGRGGEKRRYMFGVDDAVLRHNWVASLRRQVEVARGMSEESTSAFARAAEEVAFRVLQDTLCEEGGSSSKGHSATGSTASLGMMNGNRGSTRPLELRRRADAAGHTRSKSRSQMYARHGAGRVEAQELGLVGAANGWPQTDDEADEARGSRVWTGRELQVVCVQNSAIVGALAALGVGT